MKASVFCLALVVLMVGLARVTEATYAVAVDTNNTLLVTNADNALGPRDGNAAVVADALTSSLTLDFGEDVQLMRDVIVHYQGLAVGLVAPVEFYDADTNVVGHADLVLAASVGAASGVALYTNDVPYRFVTLRGTLVGAYGVDAVNALSVPQPLDGHAKAVANYGVAVNLNTANALGPPDGTYATVVSALNGGIEFDLGAGSEGTWHLIVYYGPLAVSLTPTISFLDEDRNVLATTSVLLSAGVGTSQTAVTYDNVPAVPYRYVRMDSILLNAFLIDAIETVAARRHLASRVLGDEDEGTMSVVWNNTLPGYHYNVQATQDLILQDWTTIATNVLSADRSLTIDDIDVSAFPYRHFRLAEVGPAP